MELPKGLNVRQLIEYAKENGFDSVKFIGHSGKGSVVGEFLDAYYEFVKIPAIGYGFVMMKQIEEALGYDILFDVLDEKTYKLGVNLDCILWGKEPIYKEED